MEALKQKENKLISLNLAKRIVLSLIMIFIFDFFLFPAPVFASAVANNLPENQDLYNEEVINIENNLPETNDWQVARVEYHTATAYNSEAAQCDSNPCITATGFNLCEHGIEDTIAANFLKFGTKVRIPDLYGDRVFIVRDRMNSRYSDRIDIWMLNKEEAKEFGVKVVKLEILGH